MTIYMQLSKLIPEGKFKQRLRKIFYWFISIPSPFGSYRIVLPEGRVVKFTKRLFYPYDHYQKFKDEIEKYFKYYTPKEGDVIVEAGGYQGDFTLYVAKLIGETGRLIVFEPDPINHKLLIRNIRLNELSNVIVIKKGLWNKEGKKSFFIQDTCSRITPEGHHYIHVCTLDKELYRMNVTKLDFIKMDIEGAEIEAVTGGIQTILRCKPKMAIASYHVINGKPTHISLDKTFKAYNIKTTTDKDKPTVTFA